CHHIDQVPLSALKVRDVAQRLKRERLTRLPFIDDQRKVHLMVHRSMVDHYLSSKVTESDGTVDVMLVTVAEMLDAEPDLKGLFESSFGSIAPSARLPGGEKNIHRYTHNQAR